MKIQRLIGLICVLADVDKITVQELADRFEVSKRTIFRDLDTLNLAGIPIISYPGEYFTSRDPERNCVPLHWFFFANHRFAFGIH